MSVVSPGFFRTILVLVRLIGMLENVGGKGVGTLNKTAQGVAVAGSIDVALGLRTLEGEVPGCHVPADGQHLAVTELETAEEEYDDALLAVPHGKIGKINVVTVEIFPHTHGVLAFFDDWLVDFGLINIMEERAKDNTVFAELVLEVRTHTMHNGEKFEGSLANIEAVLYQSAAVAEVEAGRGRSFEEAQLLEVFDDVVNAFAVGASQQAAELFLVLLNFIDFEISEIHEGYKGLKVYMIKRLRVREALVSCKVIKTL